MSIEINVINEIVQIDEASEIVQINASGGIGVPSGGLTNQFLAKNSNTNYDFKWANVLWGQVSGTLSDQTDLQNALNLKVPTSRTLTINGVAYDLSANRSWTIASGGGSSIAYYLNGSVNQGTIGGSVYYEMNKTPIIGAGTDFSIAGNGLISQFITDVADPNRLQIPAGNWTFEMYMSASSPGGTPRFYVELLKYDGTTFTSIASSAAAPEGITNGTTIDLYVTALAVPLTTLLATDRLALRVYIVNSAGGRTITMHTENSHLCEIITNFPGDNIYTADGTLTSARTLTQGGFNLDFIGSVFTNRFTSAGRLLVGNGAESTFQLDVNGSARIKSNLFLDLDTYITASDDIGSNRPRITFGTTGIFDKNWTFVPNTSGGIVVANAYQTISSTTAIFEIASNTRGFLPPRMTSAERTGITSPATGLLVYQTDGTEGLYEKTASAWRIINGGGGGGGMAIGGAITSATAGSVLFAGASGVLQQDNANLFWDDANNRLGIGTASPTFALDTRSDAVVNGWVIGKGSNTSLFNLRITEQTNTSFSSITTAANNIFIGRNTGLNLSTGSGNVGVGQGSGQVISTGSNNLCIGALAAVRITTGSGNIVVGAASLNQVTTQNNNVVIGSNSGSFTYPSFNNALPTSSIYIGANLFPGGTATTNEIVISSFGDLSGLGSNTTMIGNGSTITAAIRGRLLLGTTTDSGLYQLDVNGTARVSGNTTFGTLGTGTGMFWDNTNNRLGIGTSTPTTTLDIVGNAKIVYSDNAFGNGLTITNTNTGSNAYTGIALENAGSLGGGFQYLPNTFGTVSLRNQLLFYSLGQSKLGFVANAGGVGGVRQDIYFSTLSTISNMQIYGATGNVVIQNGGAFTDTGFRLDVNGTFRAIDLATFTGGLQINSTTVGFLPPRMTTTQKNAIITTPGLIVFDITLNKLCVYGASSWETITSI
jgi:hypothetical protein